MELDTLVSIVMGCDLNDCGSILGIGWDLSFFVQCPDLLWNLTRLLSSRYSET
jgi:hypothetical protein